MNISRSFFALLLGVLFSISARAQWSYIYIQGDKQVPFYVKLEGEMLPRYGKNYCIIPQLSAEPVHLQILFQQNLFPPQNYTVNVPADGARAFLLIKKGGNYALYDIDRQTYLYPGEQDIASVNKEPSSTQTPALPPASPSKGEMIPHSIPPVPKTTKEEQPVTQKNDEPEFMNNVVLNNGNEQGAGSITLRSEERIDTTRMATTPEQKQEEQPQEEIVLESNTAPVLNSDCPAPMEKDEYDRIYSAASESGKGDKLITYLLKKVDGNCYTTRQVFQLADLMDEEALIYLYLKRIYPRVTDQQNFPLLEQYLFESEEWVRAFRLIPPQ